MGQPDARGKAASDGQFNIRTQLIFWTWRRRSTKQLLPHALPFTVDLFGNCPQVAQN